MNRIVRHALRGAAVIVVLLVGAAVATLTAVDPDPGMNAPWRLATQSRLAELTRQTNTTVAPLRAGFARARLTPTLGVAVEDAVRGEFPSLPLAGYGNRNGRTATGVLDDLWIKAVAFAAGGRTGIVVTADALIIPRDVSERAVALVAATTGLRRDQLYFSATHSHCGLGGWGEGWVGEAFAGPFRPGVQTWFSGQLAAAATNALADLSPAALGTGSFSAPQFVRNRLVGDRGRVDPVFSLVSVRQDGGDTAILGSFSAHATVQGAGVMQFSADYPGVWQRAVERQHGGMALFLAGGVGSHSPKPPTGGRDGTLQMGEALAAATLQALQGVGLSRTISFGQAAVEADLPQLQNRITDGIRLRPWVARRLLPSLSPRTFLQAMRLENSVWCSTPCDYSGEMALDLQGAACRLGLTAVVTSFNGDYIGYVIPPRYYHLDGYEPRVMSFYGPVIPEYFDQVLKDLVAAVSQQSSASE